MKLSFSTKGWHDSKFDDFCAIANDLHFEGIELHNIHNRLFTDKDGAFHDYAAAATTRMLYERKLSLPCIDAICEIGDPAQADAAVSEIRRCLEIASNLHIPHLRLRTEKTDEAAKEAVIQLIERVLGDAEEKNVILLLETSALFARTDVLRQVLEYFASDFVAALWNLSAAYFGGGEAPEDVIKNLGAYVKHVHFSDAARTEDGIAFCLAGEGELPVRELMLALRSVNYDGFISLVWDPAWCEELDSMEIIFAQFAGFMRQFSDTAKKETTLYYNKTHTGRFVWKKDVLIDCTFSQVLDRMVEEFPDQYAFKYTTLDYTRTYREFRDDVDEFARTLVALGVKAGSHVAVWASNVPQWYIAFWATVKIGAV
ncbi:MAG: AMP-binding protein, partial [Clostridia bacterium]|nr:AMP-binding protein [Clostridia bacterium]